MTTRTDWTGIAYLTALALAGVAAWTVYRKAAGIGPAVGELVQGAKAAAWSLADYINPASSGNVAARAADAAASTLAGRPTSIGSLAADVFPSAAEQQVNAPGFWINEGRPTLANLRPLDEYEFSAPFEPPGFVGTLPPDPERPAIIYRNPRRTLH